MKTWGKMNFLIDKECSLIEKLSCCFKDSSKRTLSNWIKNGRILVNAKPIKKPSHPLKKGDEVSIRHKEKLLPYNIKLLYEDDFILIVDKPQNLLSVPKDTPNSINALKVLRRHFKTQNIFAVHRIDRGTSGIILFAKSFNSTLKFKEIFKRHSITRKYFAIVEGRFVEESGTWRSYLKENESNLKVYTTTEENGELAITHFETLHRTKNFTLLSLSLETGKKHQIRVQCQEAGFPIVGDKKYGATQNPIKRICLHAYCLEFTHPFLNKNFKFTSPLPEEFSSLGADKILNFLQ